MRHAEHERNAALSRRYVDGRTTITQVAVLRETNVPFMVGYNRRFSPYAVEARRHTAGRINPLFMRCRMNAGYVPLDHWVHGPQGGGRIIGEACHIVDLFTSLTGSAVRSVSSTHLSPKTESVSPTDNVSIALTYEDGSLGVLDYFAVGSKGLAKESLELHFDEKSIVIDDYKSIRGYGVRVSGLSSMVSEKGHVQELEAFHRALKEGAYPIPLWELVQTAEVVFQTDQQIRQRL